MSHPALSSIESPRGPQSPISRPSIVSPRAKAVAGVATNTLEQPMLYADYLRAGVDRKQIRHLKCTGEATLYTICVAFPNLESLTIENCPTFTHFPLDDTWEKLQRLTLDRLPLFQADSFAQPMNATKHRLPVLKHLVIKDCPLVDGKGLFYISQLIRQSLSSLKLVRLSDRVSDIGLRFLHQEIESYEGREFLQITIEDKRIPKKPMIIDLSNSRSPEIRFYVEHKHVQVAVRAQNVRAAFLQARTEGSSGEQVSQNERLVRSDPPKQRDRNIVCCANNSRSS